MAFDILRFGKIQHIFGISAIGADGGGRLSLEAKIDGPPPREKTAPPSPRRTGPPLKDLWIFGAELKQNL